MKVGILALQGDVIEHHQTLNEAYKKQSFHNNTDQSLEILDVRTPSDFQQVDGLILPGGESTTIGKLLRLNNLHDPITESAKKGLPIYGTCAGAILLAKEIIGPQQADGLKLMDIAIQRNGYGRQLDSFSTSIEVDSKVSKSPVEAVFIRAPIITEVKSEVQILATHNQKPVFVQQKNLLASTFHPELTNETAIHQYFLSLIDAYLQKKLS